MLTFGLRAAAVERCREARRLTQMVARPGRLVGAVLAPPRRRRVQQDHRHRAQSLAHADLDRQRGAGADRDTRATGTTRTWKSAVKHPTSVGSLHAAGQPCQHRCRKTAAATAELALRTCSATQPPPPPAPTQCSASSLEANTRLCRSTGLTYQCSPGSGKGIGGRGEEQNQEVKRGQGQQPSLG